MALAGSLLRGALDLVFAPICVACGGPIPANARERLVCGACWSRARRLPAPRCERCWMPLPLTGCGTLPACRECETLRPALRAVRSAYLLAGPVRPIVHALKYRGWHSVAGPMGERMAALDWPNEVRREAKYAVPVPLTRARLRHRGYNQAASLARSVARSMGIRCLEDTLVRTRSAGSQTTLHPGERRANVARAFRVAPETTPLIAAEHLLLVDDVWTTGATALACADALLEAGARAVSVATFARALPELERHERRLESAAIS